MYSTQCIHIFWLKYILRKMFFSHLFVLHCYIVCNLHLSVSPYSQPLNSFSGSTMCGCVYGVGAFNTHLDKRNARMATYRLEQRSELNFKENAHSPKWHKHNSVIVSSLSLCVCPLHTLAMSPRRRLVSILIEKKSNGCFEFQIP